MLYIYYIINVIYTILYYMLSIFTYCHKAYNQHKKTMINNNIKHTYT